MVYDIWYRDRKFNPALQEDGSLNFAGFFKRPKDSESYDPLAIIIDGFKTKPQNEQLEIKAPCSLYISSIERETSTPAGVLSVTALYLKLEPPQMVDARKPSLVYHGYKITAGMPIIVKRYKEIKNNGGWRIFIFGQEKRIQGLLLEELITKVNDKKLAIRDYVPSGIVGQLYKLWHP